MLTALEEESLESLLDPHLVGANGYVCGDPADYARALCLDPGHVIGFLQDTQSDVVRKLAAPRQDQPRPFLLKETPSPTSTAFTG